MKLVKVFIGVILVAILSLTVYASADGGSCNGNHGPWTISCSGDTYSETRTHTFDYKGYRKTCTYEYVIAYTDRTCEYCGYNDPHYSTHSHGYRGHASECGWTNSDSDTCFLN